MITMKVKREWYQKEGVDDEIDWDVVIGELVKIVKYVGTNLWKFEYRNGLIFNVTDNGENVDFSSDCADHYIGESYKSIKVRLMGIMKLLGPECGDEEMSRLLA